MDELPTKTVVCRTDGCSNEGVPLVLPCAAIVTCGPCGERVADVEEVPDEFAD